jgi:hypothetical protein
MTGMSAWSPGDPGASSDQPTTTDRPGFYRNKLGAIWPSNSRLTAAISMQFSIGPMQVTIERAGAAGLDELAKASGRRLRRAGYKCGPLFRTEVVGLADGRGRTFIKKPKFRKPAGESILQLFALPLPYCITLTVPEVQAEMARNLGPIRIDPPAPPAISPLTWIPVPDLPGIGEKLILTVPDMRLTAMITSDPVTASTDQFAMDCLYGITTRLGNAAMGEAQPDTFLGGQYCIRRTFVHGGGTGSAVRSEYWWAGAVAGYGVQIFVLGTKTIIDVEHARQLMDFVALIPPN